MIDPLALVVTALKGVSTVTALAGSRIYASKFMPAEYKTSDGPAVLISIRGGSQDYSSHVHSVSLQISCFGETEMIAQGLNAAVYDALNDTYKAGIIYCQMEEGTYPVQLIDQGTEWSFMLSFYKVYIHQQ